MSHKQTVAILGSTGSIGTQTLDVIDRHSELFEVYALTAHSNIDLLVEQAKKYRPEQYLSDSRYVAHRYGCYGYGGIFGSVAYGQGYRGR